MVWLTPSRPNDVISLGVAPAWTSSSSREENPGLPTAEWQNEITYVFVVNKWLTLQADLQYLNFPNGDRSTYKNSLISALF